MVAATLTGCSKTTETAVCTKSLVWLSNCLLMHSKVVFKNDLQKLLKGGLFHDWLLFYETTVVTKGLGSLAAKVHLEYEYITAYIYLPLEGKPRRSRSATLFLLL